MGKKESVEEKEVPAEESEEKEEVIEEDSLEEEDLAEDVEEEPEIFEETDEPKEVKSSLTEINLDTGLGFYAGDTPRRSLEEEVFDAPRSKSGDSNYDPDSEFFGEDMYSAGEGSGSDFYGAVDSSSDFYGTNSSSDLYSAGGGDRNYMSGGEMSESKVYVSSDQGSKNTNSIGLRRGRESHLEIEGLGKVPRVQTEGSGKRGRRDNHYN